MKMVFHLSFDSPLDEQIKDKEKENGAAPRGSKPEESVMDVQIANPSRPFLLFRSYYHLQKIRNSLFGLVFCFPTSLLSLVLFVPLAYNGASIFCLNVSFPTKISPESTGFTPEYAVGQTARKWSSSSSLSSSFMYAVKEETPPSKPKGHVPPLQEQESSVLPWNSSSAQRSRCHRKNELMFKILQPTAMSRQFSVRVHDFFHGSHSNSSCKVRFFMTWISTLESFGYRELLSIESLFKSHPNACLLIVSNSLDSSGGGQLLKPFVNQGFRVTAISPDFNYIFKNTSAEIWFNRLKKGSVDPGEVSLGQNLSNLLRLTLLYKFGGIYIDNDVIVLKSFSNFRNAIGAQTIDLKTGNWSRLNNAVMVFDKKHPLLNKFIEEFALTFNGNKWGHNGPYLVSRVVSRVSGRPGFSFTVLPPPAFYPVDWNRVPSLFHGPRDAAHLKWLSSKLKHIHRESFAVHLWNKQSRKMKVEEGSIINHIMLDCCIFCNYTVSVS
ncbi:PREDICTED: uncharacterized protein At4g19900-like [Nelumbo nucifera]|uniref:Alpha 1,4-glycosyltransferase domain-containing protein n=2 Tax=Nelumbo nucifera TaxID=4432 RepID=A0A822XMF4_NELNU|nr:PREDICTED: uncharacterized protein At4g19900-like [Nelumbo nucifera]DAD20883.1 TPA_asm: hypothetical protein HUJ06_022346 [Nelumbo nucifera]